MSLEAILTVITLVLAVLAIIPQERSQDLRIRLGGSATKVAILATGLVLYWSLLEPLHALPGVRRLPRFIAWLDRWDPASSSLAVFLLATVYAWWTYGRQISAGRLPKLGAALSDALARRRSVECTHLLETHLETIRDGLAGSYWQSRLRKRLFPTYGELHFRVLSARAISGDAGPIDATNTDSSNAPGSSSPIVPFPVQKEHSRLIRWFTEWAEQPKDAAHDIVRAISLSPQLVRDIAVSNPYLGLSLSQLPSTWLIREFTETLAQAFLSDPESAFYRELRRAENIDSNNVPIVDPVEQPLLTALCEDAIRRDGPRLLYTYLEAGIEPLRWSANNALLEALNHPIGDYYERSRWFSPPFAMIYLLEIIAPRSAVSADAQGVNLFVLSTLVTLLLEKLSPSDDVDVTREWPTPMHYLLYASVSLLVDLVGLWRDRPSDLPPNRLADLHDGLPRILPVHAIDVLSSIMYTVLVSRKLDPRFKGYLLEVWWRAYWKKYDKAWPHSGTVLSGLVKGGHVGARDMKHREGLAEAMNHIDLMTQISEGGDNVRAAFGLPSR